MLVDLPWSASLNEGWAKGFVWMHFTQFKDGYEFLKTYSCNAIFYFKKKYPVFKVVFVD